jgi:hypothetical protein
MSSTQNGGASMAVSTSSAAGASSSDSQQISRVPTYACFQHATKVAILEDKPIILDYWTSSLDKTCLIGVRSNNEKLLVKSEDEYPVLLRRFSRWIPSISSSPQIQCILSPQISALGASINPFNHGIIGTAPYCSYNR